MHGIQATLQLLLQPSSALSISFLRSGILSAPAPTALRDGHSRTISLRGLARLDAHVLSEPVDLLQNHLAHLADVLDDLEVEVECRRAARLVRRVVPDVQVSYVFLGSW